MIKCKRLKNYLLLGLSSFSYDFLETLYEDGELLTWPIGEFGVDFVGEVYDVGFLKGDWINGEIGEVIAEV